MKNKIFLVSMLTLLALLLGMTAVNAGTPTTTAYVATKYEGTTITPGTTYYAVISNIDSEVFFGNVAYGKLKGIESANVNRYVSGVSPSSNKTYYKGEYNINVEVLQSVAGFDSCTNGTAVYMGNGVTTIDDTLIPSSNYAKNEWRYFCNAGGAQDVKIYLFSGLEQLVISASDVVVTTKKDLAEGVIPTEEDLVVKVVKDEKEFVLNKSLYTIENPTALTEGENTLELTINGELSKLASVTGYEKTKKAETTEKDGAFESDKDLLVSYNLIITDVTKNMDKDAINEQLKDLNKIIEVFDIYFIDSNENVIDLGNGTYKIKLKMTDNMKKFDNLKVVYIDANGDVKETFETTVEDEYLVFITTHLSNYGVIGTEKVEKQVEVKDTTPKTGIESNIEYIAVLSVMSVLGIVALKRK